MTFCPGEDGKLSRELDLYDLAFLAWCGEDPARALDRLGISAISVKRWRRDPAKYLPPDPETEPFYTVPSREYIPPEPGESSESLDLSQVPA